MLLAFFSVGGLAHGLMTGELTGALATPLSRVPLATVLVLLSAALVLGGNALLDAGWGSALRSIADRVLPNPEAATRAPTPTPPGRGRTTST